MTETFSSIRVRQEFQSRFAGDPELNKMAKLLDEVVWENPLSQDEIESSLVLLDTAKYRHHVVQLPDFKSWAVRLYLGGAQRTLGYVRKDPLNALRFADMAMLHFWKYRVRGAAEPTNQFLNFSVERAQRDLDNEPEAVALLHRIEDYLLGLGALKDSATRQKELNEKVEYRRFNRTLGGAMEIFSQTISNRLEQNTNRLEEVERSLKRLEDRQAKLIELFERAIALVGQREESLCQTYSGVDVTPALPLTPPALPLSPPTLPLSPPNMPLPTPVFPVPSVPTT